MADKTDDTGHKPASDPPTQTKLLRYAVVDGTPTIPDSQLVQVFEKAREERLLPLVMYNVNPEMTAAQFLHIYRQGSGRLLWLVVHDGNLAGWVWLDDFQNRTARSHFCFFRWLSKVKLTEEVGREVFRQLMNLKFRKGTMLQVIRAEMPAFNKPGLWFLQKVGLRVVGEIPNAAYRFSNGKFYPMIYLYLTRDLLESDSSSVGTVASQ